MTEHEAVDETVAAVPEDDSVPSGPVPLAQFEGASKTYGDVQALGPLDLAIDGEVVGLLGPNGAGKTTMIRLLMGLLRPTTGTVSVLGQPVEAGSRAVRQRIGYVPEGDAKFPDLTGVASVAYAGRLVGMGRSDALQRAHQVLDYVDLGEARYRIADTYSTGMRQRLKLAQALVHDPELLILDEPTEGVDPQARDDLLALIGELAREHGLRVLVSTHLLADVERLASHAVVLANGHVAAHGSLDELRSAESRGFLVRVNGDPARFVERLDQSAVSWQSAAPHIRVNLDDAREVLRIVRDSGLVVRHLAPVRLGLDEAFEQAVRGGDVVA